MASGVSRKMLCRRVACDFSRTILFLSCVACGFIREIWRSSSLEQRETIPQFLQVTPQLPRAREEGAGEEQRPADDDREKQQNREDE